MIKIIISIVALGFVASTATATHPELAAKDLEAGVYELTIAGPSQRGCASKYEMEHEFNQTTSVQVLNLSFGDEIKCKGDKCPRVEPQVGSASCRLGYDEATQVFTLGIATRVNAVNAKFRKIEQRIILWNDNTDHIIGHQ